MRKEKRYQYPGINGTIYSSVLLEDAYFIPYFVLTAKEGYKLHNKETDEIRKTVTTNELDIYNWEEIPEE